jgi:hypothetical protein
MKHLQPLWILTLLLFGIYFEAKFIQGLWQGYLLGTVTGFETASGKPEVMMHVAASLMIPAAMSVFSIKGKVAPRLTMFILFFCFSFMLPGAGILSVIIMAMMLVRGSLPENDREQFYYGNPLLLSARQDNTLPDLFTKPLIYIMGRLNHSQLCRMILGIKNFLGRDGSRHILKNYQQDNNYLVQLYAQRALSDDAEAYERRMKRIAIRLESDPGSLPDTAAMAELCLGMPQHSAGSISDAGLYLGKALAHIRDAQKLHHYNSHLVFLEAKCHARLRDIAGLRNACEQLRAIAHAAHLAERMELECAFLERKWEDVIEMAKNLPATDPGLKAAQAFWLGHRSWR